MTLSLSQETDDEDEAQRDIPDLAFDPQRLLLNKELGAQLETALRELPEKLRTVVLLYDIEGLAYEEIAAIVACPLGTVKSRLFNARNTLRRPPVALSEGRGVRAKRWHWTSGIRIEDVNT